MAADTPASVPALCWVPSSGLAAAVERACATAVSAALNDDDSPGVASLERTTTRCAEGLAPAPVPPSSGASPSLAPEVMVVRRIVGGGPRRVNEREVAALVPDPAATV